MLPPPTCLLAGGVQPACNRCASGVQAVCKRFNWCAIGKPLSVQRSASGLRATSSLPLHAQSPRTQCSNYFEIAGYVNTYVKTALIGDRIQQLRTLDVRFQIIDCALVGGGFEGEKIA
jgi:hypothetical protein